MLLLLLLLVSFDDAVVVPADADVWRRRSEGDGSKPLMVREGSARVRERRIYCREVRAVSGQRAKQRNRKALAVPEGRSFERR